MKRGAGCFVLCFSINPTYFGNRHFRYFKKNQELKEQLDGITERENEAPLLYPYANKKTVPL